MNGVSLCCSERRGQTRRWGSRVADSERRYLLRSELTACATSEKFVFIQLFRAPLSLSLLNSSEDCSHARAHTRTRILARNALFAVAARRNGESLGRKQNRSQ